MEKKKTAKQWLSILPTSARIKLKRIIYREFERGAKYYLDNQETGLYIFIAGSGAMRYNRNYWNKISDKYEN